VPDVHLHAPIGELRENVFTLHEAIPHDRSSGMTGTGQRHERIDAGAREVTPQMEPLLSPTRS
jgi:hypothetical protein